MPRRNSAFCKASTKSQICLKRVGVSFWMPTPWRLCFSRSASSRGRRLTSQLPLSQTSRLGLNCLWVRATVFTELTPAGRKRWDLSLLASFAAHVAILLVLAQRFASVRDLPHDVALGAPNSSGSGVIYLAPVGIERAVQPVPKPDLDLRASTPKIQAPK